MLIETNCPAASLPDGVSSWCLEWSIYSWVCWFSARMQCECKALKHKVINNCTSCDVFTVSHAGFQGEHSASVKPWNTRWSTTAPAVMYLQCLMLVFRENTVRVSSPETQGDQQLHQLWCIYSVSCWFSGRTQCECQALKHKVINNCTSCGRVVCEQEGAGPCLFCGKLVSAAFHLRVTPLFGTKAHSHIWISDAKV